MATPSTRDSRRHECKTAGPQTRLTTTKRQVTPHISIHVRLSPAPGTPGVMSWISV